MFDDDDARSDNPGSGKQYQTIKEDYSRTGGEDALSLCEQRSFVLTENALH
jgi:hypothetical protein